MRRAKTEWDDKGGIDLRSDSPRKQKISGYNTSHLLSDSQMPYRNLFFLKYLNMKTL